MPSSTPYHPLGRFIRPVDERNSDGAVTKLLGVSVNKCFIPSVANTIGTDMSKYKVVRKGQFVYIPDTSRRGDKIALAYSRDTECIVSQAYVVFEVSDTEHLLAEYLMLWFLRPEFDRYARFYSHGSAREVFDWETLCATLIPVPPVAEQARIVHQFATLEKRVALCQERISLLERTASALYRKTFVDGIDLNRLPDGWRMGTLGEVGEVVTGKTPSIQYPQDFGDWMMFVTPSSFNGQRYITATERRLSLDGTSRLQKKIIPSGSLMFTCIGSDMGKVSITTSDCISNQQINALILDKESLVYYLYQFFSGRQLELQALASGSSTMPMLSKGDFEKVPIPIPPELALSYFSKIISSLCADILNKQRQLSCLERMQELLLTQIK